MGRKIKYRCGIWTVLFFLWTASAMTGCARREEVFLEEMDSDEENSNRKAGEESTAYENNVAAGENPKAAAAAGIDVVKIRYKTYMFRGKSRKTVCCFRCRIRGKYRKFSFGFAARNANSTENIR